MSTVVEPNTRNVAPPAPMVHAEPWLNTLHQEGITHFKTVGYPGTKEEAWRTTNVAPIASTSFKLAPEIPADDAAEAVRAFSFGGETSAEVVFVNGHYRPELSGVRGLPRGVYVQTLPEALKHHGLLVEKHLGRHARIEANPFVALNTGMFQQAAVVYVARGVALESPIHLLFLTLPSDEPVATHPRVLVIAEENSEFSLVETYAGRGEGVYFTNAVTEVVAAPNARIDHCKLQQETLAGYHIATTQVVLGAAANFVSHSASLGSRITRNDLNVVLDGEHAEATLNGLVLIDGEQHVDNHTLMHHEKANCPSHELYKHVLDGHATGVFKGKIFVQKDAQKTDSKQTSKSLLLSNDAFMNSQPALEIYADDVKCTHGSTIGPVDEGMIFYLRSRGVPLAAAKHLLTYAFAADITRRIRVAPVRNRLEDIMAARQGLPQDLRITDLGHHDEAAV